MKSIEQMIDDMYKQKKERKWDTLYWLIDVHNTIIKSTYDIRHEFADIYPYCFATLRSLSERTDTKMILWTSSYKKYTKAFMNYLKAYDINFDYFNKNPECKNTETGNFSKKFYFNIIIDDKAGFEAEKDWELVYNKMKDMPI